MDVGRLKKWGQKLDMDPAMSISNGATHIEEQLITYPSRAGLEDLMMPDGVRKRGAGKSTVRRVLQGLHLQELNAAVSHKVLLDNVELILIGLEDKGKSWAGL